jgi:hypothetical protein
MGVGLHYRFDYPYFAISTPALQLRKSPSRRMFIERPRNSSWPRLLL